MSKWAFSHLQQRQQRAKPYFLFPLGTQSDHICQLPSPLALDVAMRLSPGQGSVGRNEAPTSNRGRWDLPTQSLVSSTCHWSPLIHRLDTEAQLENWRPSELLGWKELFPVSPVGSRAQYQPQRQPPSDYGLHVYFAKPLNLGRY